MLRHRIDAEMRENFPKVDRYREIARDAESVFRGLDAIIVRKTHAEEAQRLQDDLRKKLEALAGKIKGNLAEAKQAGDGDFVEKNIDYLQRKSIRNSAKTLFTDFLEAQERFVASCASPAPGTAATLDAAAASMFKAVAELHTGYFMAHGDDREIVELRDLLIQKITALEHAVERHRRELDVQGVAEQATRFAAQLREMKQNLSI
ncbi:MAG: hypothetical protein M0042_06095 [Nitrospiraceae bacterium]|nr:hypothetical protein [Nitrospiraceae bacterium]